MEELLLTLLEGEGELLLTLLEVEVIGGAEAEGEDREG